MANKEPLPLERSREVALYELLRLAPLVQDPELRKSVERRSKIGPPGLKIWIPISLYDRIIESTKEPTEQENGEDVPGQSE
ncbi:MAG: hypothetical protein AAFX06_33795 [Planctomycetota bacterium]